MQFLVHLLKEANITPHFIERMHDRLNSNLVKPNFPFEKYKQKIDFLADIEFQTTKKIGIVFEKLSKTYKSYNPEDGKTSSGNFLWIIIQHNEFDTIMFRYNNKTPDKVEVTLQYEKLEEYINKFKKPKDGKFYLKDKEVDPNYIKQNLNNKENPYKGYPRIKYQKEHWYIDTENEQLVNKRDHDKTVEFYNVDEETFEEILDKADLAT